MTTTTPTTTPPNQSDTGTTLGPVAPPATGATPPLSDATVEAFAKAAGMSPEQARALIQQQMAQAATQNQWQPWAMGSNLETGTLWLGSQSDPNYARYPGLPAQQPGGYHVFKFMWGGKQVQVTTPEFGADVHIALNSDIGENPSEKDFAKANQNTQAWFEIRDNKTNKVLYTQPVDSNERDYLLRVGPGYQHQVPHVVQAGVNPYENENLTWAKEGPTNEPKQVDKTGTVAQAIQDLYNLDPQKLWAYKNELWLAGKYSQGTKLADLNQNSLTNDDIAAFASIMMEATRYYAAGKKVTWQNLLSWQAADPSAKKRAAGANGPQPVIQLTDPATITKSANDAAEQILGRKPTPDDVSTLIALIHGHETSSQTTLQNAQIHNTGASAAGVDPAADIDQYFRTHYPNEAMAVDWGAAANEWNQMLAQTSPQPRIVGAQ